MQIRDTEPPEGVPDDPETVATVLLGQSPPGGGRDSSASRRADSGLLHSSVITIASPKDAMQLQEVERIRAFMAFTSFMCLLVAVLVPLLGGNVGATWFLAGSCGLTAMVAFVMLRVIRDASRYREWMSTVFSLVAATAVIGGYYYFGVTSAVLMIVPLGAYLLALGENFTGALLSHIYVSVSHAILSALQIAGVVPDVALVQVASRDSYEQIGILIATQAVLAATFVMARGVRRATVKTLEELDAAVTDNARRSALLHEAKQELALARQVGGPGRFSDQTVGSYRLGPVLGRGAMGEVYEAMHIEKGEFAAVKLLSLDAMRQPEIVERFLREMQIAQSLRQENIISVLEISQPDSEMPFLAMERLRGESLSEKLRDVRRLSLESTARMIAEVARGIEVAHAAGIIHRDLKPSNLFLHQAGTKRTWKILDFGVSKFMDAGDTLTAGAIVGTPTYMAPEQARGKPVTVRTDVYALGVIAYRSLTGRPAFAGKELPLILHSVVHDMPPRPSLVAPLPDQVDAVLAIALAKKPSARFASAAEFAEALAAVAGEGLSSALRERGDELMEDCPWGRRPVSK